MPADDGVVIKIVGEAGGLAEVDLDGDGAADAGLDEAERRQLAQLYDPGKSLWRVEITHFTPWDYNWPYGPPDGAGPPGMGGPHGLDGDGYCNSAARSSAASARRSARRRRSPARRTTLRYASDRVPGRRSEMTLDIPLTPATPPAPLKRVELDIEIAGQTIHRELRARAPTQPTRSPGTARTPTGARFNGRQQAHDQALLRLPDRLPRAGGVPDRRSRRSAGALGRGEPRRARRSPRRRSGRVPVGGLPAPPSSIGGWNLDVHQTYDPVGRTLYGGDGTQAQRRRPELRRRSAPRSARRAPARG